MHCCLCKGRVQPARRGRHRDPVLCERSNLEKSHLQHTPSFSKEWDRGDVAELAGGGGDGKERKGKHEGAKRGQPAGKEKGACIKDGSNLL